MFSLSELRRAVPILNRILEGSRIQRFVQPDDFRLVLVFAAQDGHIPVLLSCRPGFARICTLAQAPEPATTPTSFVEFLRAHLARARFDRAEVAGDERQASLRLAGAEGVFDLVLSIMGARGNIYLLDAGSRIVHALRPLETTRRDLRIGDPWVQPSGSPPAAGIDRWKDVPDGEYLRTVCGFYEHSERVREAETHLRRMESVLQKEENFLARKGANLLDDLGQAGQAEKYRRQGELLKGVLHTIRRGDESVTVTDFETGEQVTIPIDPRLSPAENLESYFARYQKESRGIGLIRQQLEELHQSQQEIESLKQRLMAISRMQSPDVEALENMSGHPRIRRLLARYYPAKGPAPAKARGGKEIPGKLLPKKYRTEEGLEIWVGRNDEGNDYLTTRLARGNDLFFHLEGYPGSHVVLRTGGKEEAPMNALLDACELAVHFSKLKDASRADVHVAPVKNIKKPKGAKPGLVYVLKGKTIHLRRDPRRLRNILAARMDQA